MKRRDVIKLGAVATGAGMGVPGCALPKMLGSLTGADGAAAFNAMLDEQLGRLDKPGLLHRLVEERTKKKLSPEKAAAIADKDALFRRVLSTVLITQAFRELPTETQAEPAVQDRMWLHYDQIGSTVFEITDMLAALDPKQRAQVRSTLEQQPDLAMDLGETIDSRAGSVGMSRTRRLQLRKMMAQTTFRLKNGHASSMIEEYVEKVGKLRTTDERNAAAIDLATQLHEKAFWRHQRLLAGDQPGAPGAQPGAPGQVPAVPVGQGPNQPPATVPPAGPQPAPQPGPQAQSPVQEPMTVMLHKSARSAARRGDCKAIEILGKRVLELDPEYHRTAFAIDPVLLRCRPGVAVDNMGVQVPPAQPQQQLEPVSKPEHPGSGAIRTGGYMFGIGLLVGLGSALLLAAEVFIGVFGMTAAVILVGLGLIIMLVGAIIYASND